MKSVIRGAHEIAPGLLQVECRSWPLAWWECQCWFVLTPPVSIQSGAGCILLCSPTSIATVASSPLSTRPSCSLQRFSVLGPSIWIVFGIGANNHAAIFSKIAGGLPSIAETELDDLLWHQWCQDRLYQLLDLQWGNGVRTDQDPWDRKKWHTVAECLDKPLLELAQFFICEAHFPNRTQKVSLADLTAASHNPPKFSACGGINRHSTPSAIAWWQIDFSFPLRNSRIRLSSFHASTKLIPLSEQISRHQPRCARNLFRQFRNDSVVRCLPNGLP